MHRPNLAIRATNPPRAASTTLSQTPPRIAANPIIHGTARHITPRRRLVQQSPIHLNSRTPSIQVQIQNPLSVTSTQLTRAPHLLLSFPPLCKPWPTLANPISPSPLPFIKFRFLFRQQGGGNKKQKVHHPHRSSRISAILIFKKNCPPSLPALRHGHDPLASRVFRPRLIICTRLERPTHTLSPATNTNPRRITATELAIHHRDHRRTIVDRGARCHIHTPTCLRALIVLPPAVTAK